MNFFNGLLSGLSPPSTAPQMSGLLGQFYDPKEMKRQQMKQMLLGAGIGLLSQQGRQGAPITFGESLGNALRGGMEGAQNAQQSYMSNAKMAYDMNRQAKDDAWTNTQRERQLNTWESEDQKAKAKADFLAALPEDQRRLAKQFPEQFGQWYTSQALPDPAAAAQNKALEETIKDLPPNMQSAARANPKVFMEEYTKHVMKATYPNSAGAGEYGLNPVVIQNPQTLEYQLLQPSKDGGPPKVIPLPEGFKYAPPTRTLDTGTAFQTVPTRGAPAPVGQGINKDIRGKEIQEAIGQSEGKQIASAPADMQAAEEALKVVGQIRTNSYLDRGTGLSSYGNAIRGTGGYDFQNLVDQAKSGAFLTAIQQMRGLGQLSNAEGQTATAAITRMDTATSKEAFIKALDDYEGVIRKAYDKAAGRIGAEPLSQAAPDFSKMSDEELKAFINGQ